MYVGMFMCVHERMRKSDALGGLGLKHESVSACACVFLFACLCVVVNG